MRNLLLVSARRIPENPRMRYAVLLLISSLSLFAENWPGWRGPTGDGISLEKNIPVKWSATDNIAWKEAVLGNGHASPVVWGVQVFLTACLPEREQLCLHCTTVETALANIPPKTRRHPRPSGTFPIR